MRLPTAAALILLGLTCSARAGNRHWTALGPDGGVVDVVVADPTNPLVIYAGNLGGVRKSIDGGATWSDASVGLESRPGVWTISIDPSDPSRLLAGGIYMSAGIHASTDGGAHWVPANTGLPSFGQVDAFDIVRDPGSPQTVYVATGDGFFKSTNGGTSWAATGSGLVCASCVSIIAVDPAAPGTVYVASYVDGLKKSTDGAATFGPVGTGLPAGGGPFALAATGGAVYAGFYQDGFYRSTDGGATFAPGNTGLPATPTVFAIALDPTTPATLYAVAQTAGSPLAPTLYRSTDGGTSWAATVLPSVAGYEPRAITVDVSGCVVSGSVGSGVWRSCTGGATWTNGTSGLRSVAAFSLATDPGSVGTAFLGTSGTGVFKTTDAGATWTHTSYPEIYGGVLAPAPGNPQVVYAVGGPGARSGDGGSSWTPCGSPGIAAPVLPFSAAVDPSDPNTVYVGYYGNGFVKSTDGCATWAPTNTGISPGADGRGIAIDPTNPQTLYAAAFFGGAYKSTDGGASWSRMGLGIIDSAFRIAVAPTNPSTVYAASNGYVYRSLDAGATWASASDGLPVDGVETSALIVDPQRSMRVVLAAKSDFGLAGGVWLSPDGGGHWTEITGDLHDWDVLSVAFDKNGEFLFAGNEGSGTHRIDTLCNADAECADTNNCTVDTCDVNDPTSDAFGCVHLQTDPNCIDQCDTAADCQDGNLCNVWQCAPGDVDADPRGCVFVSDTTCPTPDACHDSYCDSDSGQCITTPRTGNSCDDGEPCTHNDTCQAGTCVGSQEPVTTCKASTVPGGSVLTIKDGTPDTKDRLFFKIRKAPLANAADFGNPFTPGATGYAACLYDHSGAGGSARLIASSTVAPAGTCGVAPCWSSKGVTLRYRNRAGQLDGGIDTLELVPGAEGRTKLTLRAHGVNMDTPAGPFTPGVTLQLRRTDTISGCWGATFATKVRQNAAAGFKAKSD